MKNISKIWAGVIIGVTTLLAITSVWGDSFIVDEIPHVGAGYSYIMKGDMRLNPEHPPLAKDLAGIGMSFFKLNQSAFESNFWKTEINGQWEFGRRLIFNSGNNADLVTHAAKIPMFIFFIASAILIFHFASKLYGQRAGLIALILFSFSPTVITHARFVTTDLAALFGILFSSYFFFSYLKNQTRRNFWLAAIFFGVALLTKFSTFLLAPYFVLLALLWGWTREKSKWKTAFLALWQTIVVGAVGFIIIVWPVYYFHTWNYPPERQHHDTEVLMQSFGNRYLADPVVWMSDKPVIRAAGQYALGLLMVTQRSAGGNTTYFLGEVSRFGWRSYFPIVYFIKEPLAWWGLALMALVATGWRIGKMRSKAKGIANWARDHFEELAMLTWLAVYWFTSIRSTLNIGVRHLLPIFPFTIILVSGQIEVILHAIKEKLSHLKNKKSAAASLLKIFYVVPFILFGWYILENLKIYPYYLTYFNQAVGGPSQGHKYVVDSNLDWGQDLKRFANWVEDSDIERIEFDYFGWADPLYYLGQRYVYLSSSKYTDAEDFL
ncbi:MAG: glycosyltransferase family 39 protein, partial [bacterium]|nr:glycosyltransferase family 39 protein [bacterium]